MEIRLSTFADSNFVLGNATAPPDYPIGELPSFIIVRNVCDYLQYTALTGSVTWWAFTGQRSCRCVQTKLQLNPSLLLRRIQLLAPSFGVRPQMPHISIFTCSQPPLQHRVNNSDTSFYLGPIGYLISKATKPHKILHIV